MLSALKVIEGVMKLLNDVEVHTNAYYCHYTHNMHFASVLYNDYARILEYSLSLPPVNW